jgi:hypothetical protein
MSRACQSREGWRYATFATSVKKSSKIGTNGEVGASQTVIQAIKIPHRSSDIQQVTTLWLYEVAATFVT